MSKNTTKHGYSRDPEERKRQMEQRNPGRYNRTDPENRAQGPTPETRVRSNPICGSPRRGSSSSGPGICCQPAGWGTDHVGYGACKLHGGATKSNSKHHVMQQALRNAVIYGAPRRNITPEQALIEELQRTAGHVAWLAEQVAQLEDKEALQQMTNAGWKPSAILELYNTERQNLVKVSKVAIDSGLKEREVRLAEEQGRLIAHVLIAFVRDPELNLTPAQQIASRTVMRRHLTAIETTGQLTTEQDEQDEDEEQF